MVSDRNATPASLRTSRVFTVFPKMGRLLNNCGPRLVKELNDLKSILPLLVMAPNWAMAANWAKELVKNGFAQHSAKDIKQSLQVRVFRKNVSDSVLISRRMSTNNNPKYWNKSRYDPME
jgi:hypothetical protein